MEEKSIPKISVIVPVYKVEQYLPKCLNSILAQTFTDFELLLIDDGSPDRCGEICEQYATRDNRIRVFHKENGGVSSARQLGVVEAKGEYSIHVDSDDWIAMDMLEKMYDKAIEVTADIVISDYFRDYLKKSEIINQFFDETDNSSFIKGLLRGKLHGSLWNKLVRHSLYTKGCIKFPPINYSEDLVVVIQLALICNKICRIPMPFYHYIERFDSIATVISKQNFLYMFEASRILSEKLSNNPLFYSYLINKKVKVLISAYLSGLFNSKELNNVSSDLSITKILSNVNKFTIAFALLKLLGFPAFMSRYYKLKI